MLEEMGDNADWVHDGYFNDDIEFLEKWKCFRGEISGTKLIITKQQVEDYIMDRLEYCKECVEKMTDAESFFQNYFLLTRTSEVFVYLNVKGLSNWDDFMETLYYTFKNENKEKLEFTIVKTWAYHN